MEEKIIIESKPCSMISFNAFIIVLTIISEIYLWIVYSWPFYSTIVGVVIIAVVNFCFRNISLTVTDKRIYGKTFWGKRVDLPIDSISAVGMSIMNSIAVATAAGRINFIGIANRDRIHEVISNLIVERQDRKQGKSTDNVVISNADELKKYKELLDSGIITQEEFDTKKKQLLGL